EGPAAQVEDEVPGPALLEALDLAADLVGRAGVELRHLEVARAAVEHLALRRGGNQALAHDPDVERVAARAGHRALDRRAASAAQEALAGHDRDRPCVAPVDRPQDVAR